MNYRVKLYIVMTILVALLFSIGSTVVIHRSYMSNLDRVENESVDTIQMITGLLKLSYEGSSDKGESQLFKTLRGLGTYKTSSDVFLLYRGSDLIYTSDRNAQILDVKELADNIYGDDDVYVSYEKEEGELRYIVSSARITINETEYIIAVCKNVEFVLELRASMLKIFISSFIVIIIITIIASWILAAILVHPLSRLTKATREIAEGNLSYRSKVNRLDEIGELSRDFDKMADQLEENVTLLQKSAEEKDRFMGAFTHELKTPMTSIIGYAELLRTQELEQEDKEDALGYIYSEAKRLENMSLKLLQLFVADKEALEFKKSCPKELIEDIVFHLKPQLSEQNISIDCETEDGLVMLEPDLVKTLIINLIDNSRKAIENGGSINVIQKLNDDGVTFVIKDNGKGMPKEAIEHVTEAFYRVDKARSRAQGGAGLGLALVAKIAELHNGDINISSEVGKGTEVTITLKGGRTDE